MDKKSKKLLILFSAIFLPIVLYLILTSETVKNTVITAQQAKEQKIAQLENDYQFKAKEFFTAFEAMIAGDNLTAGGVADLKSKLLDLKVPTKFKELHLNFVLALIRMENYLNQNDEREKVSSAQIANQLKADYGWLN